jgi:ATP-dependent RNA circularization protein (DNA/RNA ligase family)
MKEYHKIETLFERDEGSKKLIIGKFRSETIEYLKDNKWLFTEKIDGTNIRVFWDGHRVTLSGRTDTSQMPSHLMNKLFELFSGEVNEEMFEQKFGETPVVLYGEGYGAKIQTGGLYRSDVSFILFDVEIDNLFLKRESVEDIARYFGLEIVPIVCTGTIQDGVDFVLSHANSTIGTAVMEGVVGRPETELFDRRGNRVIVKIKRKDFF